MVATINPNDKSVKILSIPRDTRTEIIGRGTMDKINHAHAFGGVGDSDQHGPKLFEHSH